VLNISQQADDPTNVMESDSNGMELEDETAGQFSDTIGKV